MLSDAELLVDPTPQPRVRTARSGGPLQALERKLLAQIAEASAEHRLIEPNDRIMVAVSGGKDSMSLLSLLHQLRKRTPFDFEIIAVNLDQGHPGFPKHVLPDYFTEQGFAYRIIEEDTLSIVQEKIPSGNTYCSLCSRLRRGILYNVAEELGATKLALGHHRDDSIETLMLNLFYSGQIKAMPARLHSDDGRNTVIRPLIYSAESDIAEYARLQEFPIIPCNLCGSQENLKRQQIKRLISELEQGNPKLRGNLLASLHNVRVSHLLDRGLSRSDAAENASEPAALNPGATPARSAQAGSAAQLIPSSGLKRDRPRHPHP